MKRFLTFLFSATTLFAIIIAAGCTKIQRTDDAIRIKPDSARKYNNYPFNPLIIRNGNTLRGTVLKIQTIMVPDSCPPTPQTKIQSKTNVIFLDNMSPNLDFVEYIPAEDVDFIGPRFGQPLNVFENFNFPLEPKKFRLVPWDTVFVECRECGCSPFSLIWRPPELSLELECPTRSCNWYFLEIRGGYTAFNDNLTPTRKIASDGFFGEIAGGVRFGKHKQYGAGILLSTGVPIYNSYSSTTKLRPLALFHLRWDPWKACSSKETFIEEETITETEKVNPCDENYYRREIYKQLGLKQETLTRNTCFSPFFYFDFGMPIDKFSLDLVKLNLNTDCKNKIKASAPFLKIDFLPITFTIGAGIDFPISKYFDLSFDAGFRSYAFGESQNILGYANVPSYRRVNMFFFRTGITF